MLSPEDNSVRWAPWQGSNIDRSRPLAREVFESGEAGIDAARNANGPTFALVDVTLRGSILQKKLIHTSGKRPRARRGVSERQLVRRGRSHPVASAAWSWRKAWRSPCNRTPFLVIGSPACTCRTRG